VRRAAGRRRLRILLVLASLGAFVGGVLAVLHSPLLSARVVKISGATHESRAEVLSVTGLGAHPPLIDINTAADTAALERLPWVASASVARDWPTGVTVTLTERQPLAAVARPGGGVALVDTHGRVVADATTAPGGLAPLALNGPAPAPGADLPAADAPLLAAARALPVSLLPRVQLMSMRPGEGLTLQLHAGPLVVLGGTSALAAKMTSLVTLLDRAVLSGVKQVDLRVATAPVLTP
jgi:cell division protein FtsQ